MTARAIEINLLTQRNELWLDRDMETTAAANTATRTFAVNWSKVNKNNGHSAKAIQALKDSGYTFDPADKTWTGEADFDYRGKIAHYVTRGTLVEEG